MAGSGVRLDMVMRDLIRDYRRVSKAMRTMALEDESFSTLLNMKIKLATQLRYLIKLRGPEPSEEDFLKLLEKIPGKQAKNLGRWVVFNVGR